MFSQKINNRINKNMIIVPCIGKNLNAAPKYKNKTGIFDLFNHKYKCYSVYNSIFVTPN
jgi:hypothetical protein